MRIWAQAARIMRWFRRYRATSSSTYRFPICYCVKGRRNKVNNATKKQVSVEAARAHPDIYDHLLDLCPNPLPVMLLSKGFSTSKLLGNLNLSLNYTSVDTCVLVKWLLEGLDHFFLAFIFSHCTWGEPKKESKGVKTTSEPKKAATPANSHPTWREPNTTSDPKKAATPTNTKAARATVALRIEN